MRTPCRLNHLFGSLLRASLESVGPIAARQDLIASAFSSIITMLGPLPITQQPPPPPPPQKKGKHSTAW